VVKNLKLYQKAAQENIVLLVVHLTLRMIILAEVKLLPLFDEQLRNSLLIVRVVNVKYVDTINVSQHLNFII